MAKILVAETSYLVRKGLMTLLEQTDGITELKAAGHPDTVLLTLKEFHPDILLLNSSITFPVANRELQALLPENAKIVYIINTPLPDDSPADQISVFDTKKKLIEKLNHHIQQYQNKTEKEETEELTPREKLILKHVALGHTNKEIAAKLYISTHTVISHRKNITRKLDIKTVSGLTVYAILNGIIKMEDIQ